MARGRGEEQSAITRAPVASSSSHLECEAPPVREGGAQLHPLGLEPQHGGTVLEELRARVACEGREVQRSSARPRVPSSWRRLTRSPIEAVHRVLLVADVAHDLVARGSGGCCGPCGRPGVCARGCGQARPHVEAKALCEALPRHGVRVDDRELPAAEDDDGAGEEVVGPVRATAVGLGCDVPLTKLALCGRRGQVAFCKEQHT